MKKYTVPEIHRPFVESQANNRVKFSFTMPREFPLDIAKSEKFTVDLLKLAGSSRLVDIFTYGLNKKIRDGAKTKDRKGDLLNGDDLKKAKVDHATNRIQWIYGEIEMQSYGSPKDLATNFMRGKLARFIVKNYVLDDGTKYTAKTIPSSVVNATTVEECIVAAVDIGIPNEHIKLMEENSRLMAKLHSDDDLPEIDTDELTKTLNI